MRNGELAALGLLAKGRRLDDIGMCSCGGGARQTAAMQRKSFYDRAVDYLPTEGGARMSPARDCPGFAL